MEKISLAYECIGHLPLWSRCPNSEENNRQVDRLRDRRTVKNTNRQAAKQTRVRYGQTDKQGHSVKHIIWMRCMIERRPT